MFFSSAEDFPSGGGYFPEVTSIVDAADHVTPDVVFRAQVQYTTGEFKTLALVFS